MWAGIKKFTVGIALSVISIACISNGFSHVTSALESTNRNELRTMALNKHDNGLHEGIALTHMCSV